MVKLSEPVSLQQEEVVVGFDPNEEAAKEEATSGAMNDAPGAEHASHGGMKTGQKSSGVGACGGPREQSPTSITTAEKVLVGASSIAAIQSAVAAKGHGAVQACGGGVKSGGKSRGIVARGGPTKPASASTTTAEQVLAGVSFLVAIHIVAAVKSCDAGDGRTVGSDVMKAKELGNPQQERNVVGVATEEEEEAEESTASGAIYGKPGAAVSG
jgi:hypothetical protein